MKKINLEGLDETVFHEKLDNGLNVYVLRKKDYNSFSCYFITNYGALINKFVPINSDKEKTFPNGIAHFLEHKMFEQETGLNVMEKFASLAGTCNAFTNYEYTTYYVNGVDNLEENLLFLLDYVQSPYFTDENVEKEKGIIDQERLMIIDNPYRNFSFRILQNIFKNYRYGESVVGSKEDIYSITKEDLYECYNTFYNPSNMSLIVVSNEDEKKIIDLVKENQSKKKFDKQGKIKIEKIKEEKDVNKKYDVFKDNVSKQENSYNIKIKLTDFNLDIEKILVYIHIMLSSNFGKISGFNLELKNKKLINQNIHTGVSRFQDFAIISIDFSSDKEDEIIKMLDNKFNNIEFDEETFNLIRKNLISRFVYYFSNPNSIMSYLYGEYFDNKTIPSNTFTKYKELNYKEYKDFINQIDFNNKSITIMKPLDKE